MSRTELLSSQGFTDWSSDRKSSEKNETKKRRYAGGVEKLMSLIPVNKLQNLPRRQHNTHRKVCLYVAVMLFSPKTSEELGELRSPGCNCLF